MWKPRNFLAKYSSLPFFLIHVFLGPPLGAIGTLLLTTSWTHGMSDLGQALRSYYFISMMSYYFGFIPAVMHASIMLVFSRTASHITTWLLMVPLSSVLSGAIFVLISTLFHPQGVHLKNYLDFALISLIAAVLCLAVAVVLRQLPPALDRDELWEPW